MFKWIRRKFLELNAEALRTNNAERLAQRFPLEDQIDDYADHQIAWLLRASSEYRAAKKDPNAFVEKYFSEKIKPIKPYVDSWTQGLLVEYPDKYTRYYEDPEDE
jgi:hypothetical protein